MVAYQEMVTIIRDRLKDMIKRGMTLEQVKAAKPTEDWDPLYGTTAVGQRICLLRPPIKASPRATKLKKCLRSNRAAWLLQFVTGIVFITIAMDQEV